jgi:hypothetical protein
MQIRETFKIRRYWLARNTPNDVLDTLNYRWGNPEGLVRAPYVDIQYWGDGDKNLTMMELKYSEWIMSRQELTYTVEGDDGLGN